MNIEANQSKNARNYKIVMPGPYTLPSVGLVEKQDSTIMPFYS